MASLLLALILHAVWTAETLKRQISVVSLDTFFDLLSILIFHEKCSRQTKTVICSCLHLEDAARCEMNVIQFA